MRGKIKCVVWDLDNTVWDGILLEDQQVTLNQDIVEIIKELDRRGILNSISSKNNQEDALEKIKEFGIEEYFLCPQINWMAKSKSMQFIAEILNLPLEAFAFIDDQQFELDEVKFNHAEVSCFHVSECKNILELDEFTPLFITEDSLKRRKMYQESLVRKSIEDTFEGTELEFLQMLDMKLEISYAVEEDLKRVEELTVRTHQLNSTGYTYTFDELKEIIDDPQYQLFVLSLKDKYGDYGKVGIVLINSHKEKYNINLFLLSCRVISKGIGSAAMLFLKKLAVKNGKSLEVEFIHTSKNRKLHITFLLNGFEEVIESEEKMILVWNGDSEEQLEYPVYLQVIENI